MGNFLPNYQTFSLFPHIIVNSPLPPVFQMGAATPGVTPEGKRPITLVNKDRKWGHNIVERLKNAIHQQGWKMFLVGERRFVVPPNWNSADLLKQRHWCFVTIDGIECCIHPHFEMFYWGEEDENKREKVFITRFIDR